MNASQDVTEDELLRTRSDEDIEDKLSENPLHQFLFGLVELLEVDSQESQSLERDKHVVLAFGAGTSTTSVIDTSSSDLPSTPPYSQLHYPQSYDGVSHKRKISVTSFETKSTETTPNKLGQPEAKVQSLQDAFVRNIIIKLWRGKVGVDWARNRHMFLTYDSYPPPFPLVLIQRVVRRACPFSTVYRAIPKRLSLGG